MSNELKPIVGPDGRTLSVGEREPITTEHMQAVMDWPRQQRAAALREHDEQGRHKMPHHAVGFVLADMGRRGRGGHRIVSAQLYQRTDEDAFTIVPDNTVDGRAELIAGEALPAAIHAIPAMMGGFGFFGLSPGAMVGRVCLEVTRLGPTTIEVVRFLYSDAHSPPLRAAQHGPFAFTLYGWG